MRTQVFQQILQAMHANGIGLAHHLRITACARVRGSNSNVVGFRPEVIKAFLYRDTDRAATAPEPNKKIRLEARLENIGCQLERIQEQIVCGDKSLVHYCNSWCVLR